MLKEKDNLLLFQESLCLQTGVKLCYEKGVTEIVVGDVKGIRQDDDKNAKANAMIHNFWSFRYVIERLKTTAENFGIKVKLVKENHIVNLPKMWFKECNKAQEIVQMFKLWIRSS